MPSAAIQFGEFYQWSPTSAPVVAATALTHLAVVEAAPAEPPDIEPEQAERLTDRLNAKLAELRAAEFAVLWITAPVADLTTLLMEGGEYAIVLDPDPARDVAWYGGREIRVSTEASVQVYFRDDLGEMNCAVL